jgi:hypothetical protein
MTTDQSTHRLGYIPATDEALLAHLEARHAEGWTCVQYVLIPQQYEHAWEPKVKGEPQGSSVLVAREKPLQYQVLLRKIENALPVFGGTCATCRNWASESGISLGTCKRGSRVDGVPLDFDSTATAYSPRFDDLMVVSRPTHACSMWAAKEPSDSGCDAPKEKR